jgi:hypothetical protein
VAVQVLVVRLPLIASLNSASGVNIVLVEWWMLLVLGMLECPPWWTLEVSASVPS